MEGEHNSETGKSLEAETHQSAEVHGHSDTKRQKIDEEGTGKTMNS